MEVSPLFNPYNSNLLSANSATDRASVQAAVDTALIESISTRGEDKFLPTYTGLAISADEILEKINESLSQYGRTVEQLRPEDATPEATANRILKGVEGFFGAYKDQNPDLSDEELVDGFIEAVGGGIEKGYAEAYEILKGIGAFSFEGVEEGVDKTLSLLKSGLGEMRTRLLDGLTNESQIKSLTSSELQVSAALYVVA